MPKSPIANARRVLLKLSGEALQGSGEYGIDVAFLHTLCEKIIFLVNHYHLQVVIVIGWGNIFRGLSRAAEGLDRSNADYLGILATVMNGVALGNVLEQQGQPVRIMSAIDIPCVAEHFVRRHTIQHLTEGRIVVCVAGTGNPYYTTDSAAVLRALELDCDCLVKGTKVDGVYDKDPKKHPDAVRYDTISLDETIRLGLRVMDQTALAMARDEWLPIFVCSIDDIDRILSDDITGTYVSVG